MRADGKVTRTQGLVSCFLRGKIYYPVEKGLYHVFLGGKIYVIVISWRRDSPLAIASGLSYIQVDNMV